MTGSPARGIDPLAAIACAISAAMGVVYVLVIRAQGDSSPAWWVLAMLGVAAVLTGVAAARRTPRRSVLLLTAGCLLVPLGILGILTIGVPILVAGALAILAGARSRLDGGPATPGR